MLNIHIKHSICNKNFDFYYNIASGGENEEEEM